MAVRKSANEKLGKRLAEDLFAQPCRCDVFRQSADLLTIGGDETSTAASAGLFRIAAHRSAHHAMADYYPLIARAVGQLKENNGQIRCVLYERARNALVTQMREASPAFSPEVIDRERLALESAIRRVEAEATGAAAASPAGTKTGDNGASNAVVKAAQGSVDSPKQAAQVARSDARPAQREPKVQPSLAFFDAIEDGNIDAVRQFLAQGVDVNGTSPDGWSGLLSAARGDVGLVRMLLEAGADSNIASPLGYTPLMRAAGHGADDNVRALIDVGTNLEAKDNENQSALDMAYAGRFPKTAKILEDALRAANKGKSPAAPRAETARGASSAGPTGSALPMASRTIPVFISSTFLDMHAERDLLRTYVLPALEEKLKERNVYLELVDLRWGVDASAEREQHARMLKILRVCFGEIDRCRPYFIALLGERYGTVPPAQLVRDAAMEAGLMASADGRSITELEILYHLEKVGQVARFFAYVRDRLPFEQLVRDGLARPQVAANYAGDRVEAQRTEGLRTLLRTRYPNRTKTYAARWNAQAQAVDGLAVWRDQIVHDLLLALDEDSKAWIQQAPKSPEEAEGRAIEQFLSRPPSSSEARPGELDRLVAITTAKDTETETWGWTIGGEVGSGKTALLAGLCRRLRADGVLYLAHFVGLTPISTSIVAMFKRWIAELRALEGGDRTEPEDVAEDGIAAVFWRLLRRVSVDRRIVLVIDNLDAFGSEDRLNWLGSMGFVRPSNVRTIVSLRDFDQSPFRRRSGLESMKLEPLTKPMAESLIAAINTKYHRQAPASVVRRLLDKKRPDGQPAAGNTRWLSVAVEELNLIGREEFEEARQDVSLSGEQQIQRLLEKAVDGMQPMIDGLYASVLARAHRLDAQLTPAFAKLVALAKEGLGNTDLQALLTQAAGSCDDAQLAGLRWNFRGHLRQTSDLGLWQFADTSFRDAVLAYYKVTPAERAAIHGAVLRYLMALPPRSELRSRELMHHLIGADDRAGLARYWAEVTDETAVVKDPERARRATLTITGEVSRRGAAGVPWVTSLLRLDGLAPDEKVKLYTALFDLIPLALGDRLSMSERQGLFTELAKAVDGIRSSAPTSFDADKARLGSRIELGKAAFEAGNLREAERTFRQTLNIADEIISGRGAAVDAAIREGQAMAHEGLGRTLTALGRLDEAIASHQSAITSLQDVKAAKDPGELGRRMAHSLIYIGELRVDLRQYDQAQKCFHDAYKVAQLAADLPRDKRELTMSLAREREGDLRLKLDDLDGALQAFTEVRRYRATLLDLHAGTLEVFNEGVSAEKMGNVLERQQKFAEALRFYEEAQSAYKRVANAEPTNVSFAKAMATISGSIGDAKWGQKDAAAARTAYGHRIEILDTLRRAAPENADILRRYMTALTSIGELEKDTGRLEHAEKHLQGAIRIAEDLFRLNRQNATALRDLATIQCKRALLYKAQNRDTEAIADFERSAGLLDTAARLAPGDRRLRFDKAGILWNLGSLLSETGQKQRAAAVLLTCYGEYSQIARGGRLPPPHDQVFAQLRKMLS